MKMRKNIQDIYKLFTTSETLLRLLYNKPMNQLDDPLSPSKPNILDKPVDEKWEIINDVVKTTPKVDDLDTTPKCRLLFYPGKRRGTGNYLVSSQEVVIDVLVHADTFDQVDQRLSWILDHVNELIFDERITGMGKIEFRDGFNIPSPNGYVGYRLIYSFGSGN